MDDSSSRMYHNRYPRVNDFVMIRVERVSSQNFAKVSLVEFDGITGRLLFTDQERPLIKRGLMEPARVTHFKVSRISRPIPSRKLSGVVFHRRVVLSMAGINPAERSACEVQYTRSLHVREILLRVARIRQLPLKDVYLATLWPRYEDLIDEESPFWNTLALDFREDVETSVGLVTYVSWRIRNNMILASSRLFQEGPYCFVISIIRQLEGLLKLAGRLPLVESLSIQDLIDNLEGGLVNEDGISSSLLQTVCNTLRDIGVLSETDGPALTWHPAEPTPRDDTVAVYAPVEARVEWSDLYDEEWWSDSISSLQQSGPVAVGLKWFESYEEQEDGDEIFQPTEDEIDAEDPTCGPFHWMTLVGKGVDENGNGYWEMQDSYGNVKNGDRGFLRFSTDLLPISLILMYVEMEIA